MVSILEDDTCQVKNMMGFRLLHAPAHSSPLLPDPRPRVLCCTSKHPLVVLASATPLISVTQSSNPTPGLCQYAIFKGIFGSALQERDKHSRTTAKLDLFSLQPLVVAEESNEPLAKRSPPEAPYNSFLHTFVPASFNCGICNATASAPTDNAGQR